MDLSVVIVTYNSRVPVERCLASLERHPARGAVETIVVDNASADGTAEMVRGRFPGVRVAANDENRGYSRGVNEGIRLSTGRLILILNPDIVVGEGSIDRLAAFMADHPDAGIAGAKLVYPDGALQYSARSFYTVSALLYRRTVLGRLFPRAKPLRDHLLMDDPHDASREVDWIIGACMLVRREALERVGEMDERFFLYFEDLDWCYRMKQHGWKVFYVPESVMIHTYERSSARSVFRKPFIIHLLSLLRYYEKWNRIFYLFRRNRLAFKAAVLVAGDLAAFNAAFFAAYCARSLLQPLFTHDLYPIGWYGFFIGFYNLVFLLTFLAFGLYRVRRETPPEEELVRVARAVFLGLVILMAATYMSRVRIYSRAVVIGHCMLSIAFASLIRLAIRAAHRALVRARFDLKRVLIVGTRDEAAALAERFAGAPELGIDVVGFLNGSGEGLGGPADLSDVVERFTIQEVVVCESHQGDRTLVPFLSRVRRRMIQITMISPLARFLGSGARVEELAGIPVFSMERRPFLWFERALKRAFDFATGLAVLPFAAIASGLYRIYGTLGHRVRFFTETRRGRGGEAIRWPRVVRASGREGGDLVKPRLWLHLAAGRVSLVGPPALAETPGPGPAAALDAASPGITGRWRIARRGSAREAIEEEALAQSSSSSGRDLMILFASIGCIWSGSYPAWFHRRGGVS
jgi:hypothetical protein